MGSRRYLRTMFFMLFAALVAIGGSAAPALADDGAAVAVVGAAVATDDCAAAAVGAAAATEDAAAAVGAVAVTCG